jgi:hypothetical protein
VIPIDLRRDDWMVAYNLLRRREQVATSVVTDNLVDALAYVWRSGGTDKTPRLARNTATVFQTLMLADLWTAAKERGKGTDPKPFYLYIDEFQRFVTPTIAENLDEARGFGLHLTLAHQYPSQLIEASREYGQRLYESVMENARSKVVFSLSLRERNLAPLADWLYSGTYDPSRVKHELHTTKVMGYSEETRDVTAHGTSRGTARSEARGTGAGTATAQGETVSGGYDGVLLLNPMQWSSSTSQGSSSSDTTTRGDSESGSGRRAPARSRSSSQSSARSSQACSSPRSRSSAFKPSSGSRCRRIGTQPHAFSA